MQDVDERAGVNEADELSKEDREKIICWIAERSETLLCPVCKCGEWGVVPRLINAYTRPRSASKATKTLPTTAITCNNCHYILQFAAIPFGLNEFSSAKRRPRAKRKAKAT